MWRSGGCPLLRLDLEPTERCNAFDACPRLHVARGWRERACPTCKALPGEECTTPSGRTAAHIHEARLRPGRHELLRRGDVWEELERQGASIAVVPFWGRAGRGGETEGIELSRINGDDLVDVERWTGRDEP